MNEFDLRAKEWDKNPVNIKRANAIAKVIKDFIPISTKMSGFEYGCGTGLLSFNLSGFLKNITLADSSNGMLEALNEKIKINNKKNMKSLFIDLEKENIPEEKFDIIYTQMTLHHILDLDLIFDKFFSMLNKNGFLCIADLYEEDGSFHGKDFAGHKGFDPDFLKSKLESKGFGLIKFKECYKMYKIIDEKEKEFPIFLLSGQKMLKV